MARPKQLQSLIGVNEYLYMQRPWIFNMYNHLAEVLLRCTGHPTMTIAVDLGRKATKQTNKNLPSLLNVAWV